MKYMDDVPKALYVPAANDVIVVGTMSQKHPSVGIFLGFKGTSICTRSPHEPWLTFETPLSDVVALSKHERQEPTEEEKALIARNLFWHEKQEREQAKTTRITEAKAKKKGRG